MLYIYIYRNFLQQIGYTQIINKTNRQVDGNITAHLLLLASPTRPPYLCCSTVLKWPCCCLCRSLFLLLLLLLLRLVAVWLLVRSTLLRALVHHGHLLLLQSVHQLVKLVELILGVGCLSFPWRGRGDSSVGVIVEGDSVHFPLLRDGDERARSSD